MEKKKKKKENQYFAVIYLKPTDRANHCRLFRTAFANLLFHGDFL